MPRRALAIAALIALTGAGATASAQTPQNIGVAATVVNRMAGTVSSQQRSIGSGDQVFADEVVETGHDAKGQLLFLDETSLTVGPDSRLTLDKFVFDPNSSVAKVSMTAVRGVFRFISGSLPKQAYEIKTPAGVVGVRGTIFDLIVEADGTVHLRLVEGSLVYLPLNGQQVVHSGIGRVLVVGKDGSNQFHNGLDARETALLAPILDLAGHGGGQIVPPTRPDELREQLRENNRPTPNND